MDRCFYVYILSSMSGVLYIGVSGNLEGRILQHRSGEIDGFTKDYKCHQLVYYEEFQYVMDAIAREKQLKRWSRIKKMWLIKKLNPKWEDLATSLSARAQNHPSSRT